MSNVSKHQEQGGEEPDLCESELDSYIISIPDRKRAKKSKDPSGLPATPTKGNKNGKRFVDISATGTPSKSSSGLSPAKSVSSDTTGEGTPRKKKSHGWYGTDARVFSSSMK